MNELFVAELCYSEMWVVTTQTVWPSRPKIFTIYPWQKEFVDSAVFLFPKADRCLSFLIILELPSICHRCHVLRSFLLPGGQWSELRLCISNSLVLFTSKDLCRIPSLEVFKVATPPGQPVSVFHIVINYTSTYACGCTETTWLGIPAPGLKFHLSEPYLKHENNDSPWRPRNNRGKMWIKPLVQQKVFESRSI